MSLAKHYIMFMVMHYICYILEMIYVSHHMKYDKIITIICTFLIYKVYG